MIETLLWDALLGRSSPHCWGIDPLTFAFGVGKKADEKARNQAEEQCSNDIHDTDGASLISRGLGGLLGHVEVSCCRKT